MIESISNAAETTDNYLEFGSNYLEIARDTPFEVWLEACKRLQSADKSLQWWIGDALSFGEYRYGEQYAQALDEEDDRSYGTKTNAVYVSKAVDFSRRRENLSWSHHAEIAPLHEDKQNYWLDQAEPLEGQSKPRLSVRELRQAIKDAAKLERGEAAELPDADAERSVSEGEWWRLGDHFLYCGDSRSEDFTGNLSEAALAFADPPYNAGVAEWDYGFLWEHDYLADHAEVVAVTPGIVSIVDFARVTKMPYKWSLAGFISNGMTRGAVGYGNWIYAAVFSKESVYRQSQDAIRFAINTSETSETDHKGRKPQELMAYVIQTFTEKEDTVIDPFLGSGSTLIACESLGRKCIGAELDPGYCSAIVARYEAKSGGKAERV